MRLGCGSSAALTPTCTKAPSAHEELAASSSGIPGADSRAKPFPRPDMEKCSLGAWRSKIFTLQDPGQHREEPHMGGRAEPRALKPNVGEDVSHSDHLHSKLVPECTCY